ncbi:alpha/beta hydrolase [Aerococcaceae bacterium WGS1372]
MIHIYKEGKKNHPVFVLLHGTGGNENNLLGVAEFLDPQASILAIRGNVSENGMLRFFKRKEEGVYDLEDLEQRGKELYQFIVDSSKEYVFNLEDVILVGFSNGSNIAINMLLLKDSQLNKATLFAPMYPVDLSNNHKDLEGSAIYISAGRRDPIVPVSDSEEVINIFLSRNATVTSYWVNSHELNLDTLTQAKVWLAKLYQA